MKTRHQMILEDKEGKNINRAEKWVKVNYPEVIGSRLENGTIITPRVLTQEIRNMVPNVRMQNCKFLVAAMRIYFESQNDPHEMQSKMNKLNKILKIICTAHADEYDNDLNGMTFGELDEKFSGAVKADIELDREKIGKLQLIKKTDYEIVPIDSFKEAQKYGKYTTWCVTHHDDMYDNYTKGGLGRFYFCLQQGFEKVPKIETEGCPMDTYGKSMIAVSVNDDGSLNTCTCHWNHEHGANDNMMDTQQISEFFGVDFYKTFKPYDVDELWKKILNSRDKDDEFCKMFGCIKSYESYKKLVDGKIITLPKINGSTTFIDGKFMTMRDGKLVETKDVKTIDDYAFYEDYSLKSIVIPDGIKRIGDSSFYACSNLMSVTIPSSVTRIEACAFQHCSNLTNVIIRKGVTFIGISAFYGCSKLESVVIPDTVNNIQNFAFFACSQLKNILIGNGVTYIGYNAFRKCRNLTGITIPSSVIHLGSYAFESCDSLTSVIFKDKSLEQVKAMDDYPWGVKDESIIKAEPTLHESCHDPQVYFWAHMLDDCFDK